MGRGSSKSTGGGGKSVTSVTTQDGTVLNLSKTPLVYGSNDPYVTGAQRSGTEAQEQKRLTAKIEYGVMYDKNGNVVQQEFKGGKGSVGVPHTVINTPGGVFTHNHPRGKGEEGQLGGTFSSADLRTFENNRFMTIRASAAEGTYSLSKTLNFNKQGFTNYVKSVQSQAKAKQKAANNQLGNDWGSGKINYKQYLQARTNVFNTFLIDVHNGLLAGQKQYGYSYTLEART